MGDHDVLKESAQKLRRAAKARLRAARGGSQHSVDIATRSNVVVARNVHKDDQETSASAVQEADISQGPDRKPRT